MAQLKQVLLAVLIGVLAITAGCSEPQVESKEPTDPPGERIGDNIGHTGGTYKFVDNETGATCYVVQNGNSDPAIDCIKTNE